MKNYIHKGISLALVMTMSAWCLAGCGSTSNESEKVTKNDTVSDTANMEALLTSKVGKASDAEKNETVYVEMKPDGTVTKTTVSNVLKVSGKSNISDYSKLDNITNIGGDEKFSQDKDGNIIWENKGEDISYQGTTTEAAPIDIKITYYLDDKEIKPDDLAGKSGKIKIVYDYANNAKDEKGKFVPFLVLTGMVLDEDNFSNIQVDNGKVIEHNGTNIVVGYAVPGFKDEMLNSIPNADEYIGDMNIPESFTVTADAKDFTMDMTLTAATSGLGDLDLDETLDFSDIESQMDELQDGADQLVDGSKDLNDGAGKLVEGSGKINSGAKDLSKYTVQMAQGTKELNNKYTIFNKALLDGVKTASSGAKQLYDGTKKVEKGATDLNTGAKDLDKGASDLNTGAKDLNKGASSLDSGAQKLKEGTSNLDKGAKDLAGGISQAKSAFEDTKDSQGLVSGSAALAEGAKGANAGVQQVVQLMQGTPEKIQEQINEILAQTGYNSSSALNGTVEAINNQVAANKDASLQTVLSGFGLSMNQYYALMKANYSVQALEQVKLQLNAQIQSSAKDIKALLDGMNTLESGTATLSGGIGQVYAGMKQLDAGAKNLTAGTGELSSGASDLKKGTSDLKSGTTKLSDGASTLSQGTKKLSQGTSDLKAGATSLKDGVKKLADGANTLSTKIGDASPQIKSGVSKINDAAKAISEGAGTLSSGASTLNDGIITLADGTKELKDGAIKLNDEGISKITDIFGKDAKDAVDTIEDTLNTGKAYKSFSGIGDGMSGEVKFIFKTEEISADNK